MNYGNLKDWIKKYLHRDELSNHIPVWLSWTHTQIQKNKFFRFQQVQFDAVNLTTSKQEYDLHSDFAVGGSTVKCKRIIHILLEKDGDRVQQLEKKEYPYFEEACYRYRNKKYPVVYVRWGNIIRMCPKVSEDNVYQMILFGYRDLPFYIDDPTSDNGANDNKEDYLSINYPHLLIWGALLYAEPFIKDTERARFWADFYNQHYQSYIDEERTIALSGSTGGTLS